VGTSPRGRTDRYRKIDEPKTPYVRYDAENDLVLGGEVYRIASHEADADDRVDVPDFDLRGRSDSMPVSPGTSTAGYGK
jgi:hypothetical protein